eukprot:2606282-Pyramimonas_sp.AAC.1
MDTGQEGSTFNIKHFWTVRSHLLAGHSTRISQTLDIRPLRLRSYPLRGISFLPAACISCSP